MVTHYKEILLTARPDGGPIGPHMFEVVEKPLPQLKDGEVLVQQTHMSLDPAMLGWMMPSEDSYIPPVALNSRMRSSGVGVVVESNNPKFAKGDQVMGMMGWTEFHVTDGRGINKIDNQINPEMALSVFGLPGLTAVQGLFHIGEPKAGETIVVSGAAGSVGSIVGQLAKAEGLTVIGVVGSDEKADWIVNELGFDAAINYKSDDIAAKLDQAAPNGIDVYFENTGGPIQHHVFERLNAHARVAVCGMIADYTAAEPSAGPNWMRIITKRIKIQGYTMPDHLHNTPALLEKLTPYVMQGKVKYRAHALEGLASAMTGLNLFFTGENKGKLLVKL